MYDDDSWITGDYARVATTTQNLWTQKSVLDFWTFFLFIFAMLDYKFRKICHKSVNVVVLVILAQTPCWSNKCSTGLRSGVQPSYSIPPLRNSEGSLWRDYLLVFPVTARPLHTSHIASTKCCYSISALIRIDKIRVKRRISNLALAEMIWEVWLVCLVV